MRTTNIRIIKYKNVIYHDIKTCVKLITAIQQFQLQMTENTALPHPPPPLPLPPHTPNTTSNIITVAMSPCSAEARMYD